MPLLLFTIIVTAFINIPKIYAASLNAISLRCCTIIEPPAVIEDPNTPTGFSGLAMEYLDLLQKQANFTCSSLQVFRHGDKTSFNDFVLHLQRCTSPTGTILPHPECLCDIGTSGFRMNEDRLGRADFLPPFVFGQYRVLTHVDNTQSSTSGAFFITSFSVGVWMGILGLGFAFAFLKLLDLRFVPPDRTYVPLPSDMHWMRRWRHFLLKSKIPYRLRKALESTFTKMIGQSVPGIRGDFGSTRQRILNFTILLCGLFLVLAYEASMTALLVKERFDSRFRTIQDLKNCGIPAEDVCIPKGGAGEVFWNRAIANHPCQRQGKGPQFISDEMVNGRVINSYDVMAQKVASKECKYAIASGISNGQAISGKHCGVVLRTGEPFFAGGASFVLPKGSPLKMALSLATLELHNQDAIPTLERYVSRQGDCRLPANPSLTFRKLRMFFILSFGACILILLEMIIDPQTALEVSDQEGLQRDAGQGKDSGDGACRSKSKDSSESTSPYTSGSVNNDTTDTVELPV